jgi:CRP-like cAMP-binding protein
LWQNKNMLATTQQVEAFIKLFHQGNRLTYQKGEYIIRAGEVPSSVFYVEEGLVKAFNISKYGEENLLIIRRSHEIFPLIWALTGQEREIIYQALDTVVLWRISRADFLDYMANPANPLSPLLDMVTEMYRIHSERILNLEYRTVRERLVSFLLTMSNRFGKETPEGLLIDVPLRHQDIASSINASRETTSRELSILDRKGLISNSQLYFMIKDRDALKALL